MPPSLLKELECVLRAHEGKGTGKYDVLFLLSGGKDSAFLLAKLRDEYPALRLLAITFDNGFSSPVALANAAGLAKKLNVDHLIHKAEASFFRKTFRYACTHIPDGQGCFEVVDRADADYGFDSAKIFAAEQRIPLIVIGLSWVQVHRMFGTSSYELPAEIALKKTEVVMGGRIDKLYQSGELTQWWDPSRFPPAQHPRIIFPFYAWHYDEMYLRAEVIRRGLIEPGNDSPLVTNPTFIPVMVVSDFARLGYASFEPEFTQLIREGKSKFAYWRNVFEMTEYSARTGWFLRTEVEQVLKQLGLTRHDVGL